MDTRESIPSGANVVFIDGECVFCNRIVSFILAHDRRGLFHFAHLQGALAKEVLRRHDRSAEDVDSVYVLLDAGTPEERLLWDGKAARAIWPRLFWFATVLRWIPLSVLDFAYRAFAKRRYRLFGKYDVCHVPTPQERPRFLDLGVSTPASPRAPASRGRSRGSQGTSPG
ncbi:MAG TPA: DCC1-like thiol-disulfide oxidoreductase family protein [Polyangiaceae bacterium]